MQVTRAVDYGLRALLLMSRQPVGARFFLQDLAKDGGLPRNYLVKVLKSLACAEIVRSHRGIKGGFSLGRAPRQISLRQVFEAIDGPVTVMHCLPDPGSCSYSGKCAAEVFFGQLRQSILTNLEAQTLQDLLDLQAKIDCGKSCACHAEPAHAETIARKS
jgi:Rrf2 family protein